jgi:hypothetical protein
MPTNHFSPPERGSSERLFEALLSLISGLYHWARYRLSLYAIWPMLMGISRIAPAYFEWRG